MPTYEYVCPKCGHEFEQFQSMNDQPLTRCPKCRKLGLKRLIGRGGGIIFKGSGFYQTDYKQTSAPKEGGGDAKPAAESKAAPPASGGDPKPAPAKSPPQGKA